MPAVETHTVTLGNYPTTAPTANSVNHACEVQSQCKTGEQQPPDDTRPLNAFMDMSSTPLKTGVIWT
jgi:hypothetical protein